MTPTHLTPERWSALRQAPDDALIAHLAEGCDHCDAFLATLPGVDGQTDRALLSLTPRTHVADELAWHRFRRRGAPRTLRLLAAAAALLLSVTGAVAVTTPWLGLKGDGPAIISLRAAAREAEGDPVHALTAGASVPERATLVFRVDSTVSGEGYLFLQRAGEAPQLVEVVHLNGGVQDLERGARGMLGVSLQGERGPLVVWLVASEEALSADDARAALTRGGDRRVAVSKFEVTVTP